MCDIDPYSMYLTYPITHTGFKNIFKIHLFNDFPKDISRVRPKVPKEDSNTRSAIPAFLLRNYCLLGQIRRIILVKCAKMQAMFYCKIFNIYGAKMLGKVTNFPRMK